ncbi:putative genetic interactor of prohibitin 5, mitochondrial [[Candida] railenensis]|uniref:Genetic interactor of prohibitin 5, mitochondrial n=1 Tax=[Candida] railenensis TaxID=45579 RepID=A0A9P0QVI1_9ASCO|nr:putative genetic interactor of prohibitin 5, mitochondrial [[Candida] railenensis]
MSNYISQYRNLLRRIRKLPFDAKTIRHARAKLKALADQSSRRYQSKSTKQYIAAFDSLLVDEKYDHIPRILDIIYKKLEPSPIWVKNYNKMKFGDIISRIPQHHLMEELTSDEKTLKEYHETLAKKYKTEVPWPESSLREIDEVGTQIFTPITKFSTLPSKDKSALFDSTMQKFIENYDFVYRNQLQLTHLKLQPLEILYPITQYGQPLPLNRIKKLQREYLAKTTNIIFETIPPIKKEYIFNLYDFVASENSEVNPFFFTALQRKRDKTKGTQSPLRKKYESQRNTLPSQNSIKKIVREYILGQYYWDSNSEKYKLSPMREFYETNHAKIEGIEYPKGSNLKS